jgi:PAS domain S-box-containing protein
MHPSFRPGQSLSDSAHAILESITDAFFSLNDDWELTYINRQAGRLLGQHPADLLGKNMWAVYPGLTGTEFETLYRATAHSRTAGSVTSFYPDHGRWYEVHAYPADTGISIYFRDVTERVQSEEKIRESELRFRLMADSIPQIVWIADAEGRAVFFNRQWNAYTGVPVESMTHEDVARNFVHPDDAAATMQIWDAARRGGKVFNIEHRLRAASGQYRWFLARAEPWRDPHSGDIARWFGTSTDVHDQKLSEAALKQSEARYRFLFESIDEGFCIVQMLFDDDGKPCDYRFCEINPMFEHQTGMRDAAGRTMRELVPQHEQHWYEIYGKVALTGEPIRFENEARSLDRWFDVYAFRIDEPAARKVAILFKDITARRRMEQELADKIRSLEDADRRQAFQLALANGIRTLTGADEIAAAASAQLGRHLGATRVGYIEIDDAVTIGRMTRDWTDGVAASLTGRQVRIDDFSPSITDILRAGQVLAVSDIAADAHASPHAAYLAFGVRAVLAIPLMKSGRLRAVLQIHKAEPYAWTAEEIALAEATVEGTWVAIERAQAEEKRLQAEEQLRRIAERHAFQLRVADLLRGLSGIDRIFAATSDMLGRYFEVSRVLFGDYDVAQKAITYHSNYTDGTVAELNGTYPSALYGAENFESIEGGGIWVSHDLEHDPRTAGPASWPAFRAQDIHSGVAVPLSRQDALIACLLVHHKKPREWSPDDVALLNDVAERVWSAVERERSHQEQRQAEEKLKEADRRKDEFLAMLAHELRNPLAPIGAAAQLLKLSSIDESRVRHTSDVISRQVKHMTSLVDDLLDVSRVTRGLVKLEKAPLDMRQAVADALEQASMLIQARRHHLRLHLSSEPAMVEGDNKRLVQVITNLLNNAAKYTPEGGNIVLETEIRDGGLHLSVTDDGIGMEPELAARVFDLFTQAERSSDRSLGGLGLGLALVKSLVELHGGHVVCVSAGPGKGSRFTVFLPILPGNRAQPEPHQVHRPAHQSGKAMRVMVVDDNVDAAHMLAMYLEATGHDVLVEHDSWRALRRARETSPAVCLLDIGLPEMDGNELARRLQAQPETAGAVLIAVTGYGQDHDRNKALASGFSHYLVKPVDTTFLASLLDDIGSSRPDLD